MDTRRSVLSRSAAVAALGGGCLLFDGRGSGEQSPDETIRRGGADAVARYSATVDTDDVEHGGDGEVEIVVAYSGGEPFRTETEPFEDWAERRCLTAAQAGVWRHIKGEIRDEYGVDTSDFRLGHGAASGSPRSNGVIATYVVTLDRDDDSVVDRPAVPFDELVRITSKTASATIDFEGREHECSGPVWVELPTESEPTRL